MTTDPRDFIYVDEPIVRRGRRQTRRHVTLSETDWEAVGDPAAPGGVEGRLQAELFVNKVAVVVEAVVEEFADDRSRADAGSTFSDPPRLRVRGRKYAVIKLFAP